jgi:hypothetical protein
LASGFELGFESDDFESDDFESDDDELLSDDFESDDEPSDDEPDELSAFFSVFSAGLVPAPERLSVR